MWLFQRRTPPPLEGAPRLHTVEPMSEPTKLLDGGTFFEGPRWHDGCWWVSDFYTPTAVG